MISLGIIGTNWITEQFIKAVDETKTFELTHVYSRTLEKAQSFIADLKKQNIDMSTDLNDFFKKDFDTV